MFTVKNKIYVILNEFFCCEKFNMNTFITVLRTTFIKRYYYSSVHYDRGCTWNTQRQSTIIPSDKTNRANFCPSATLTRVLATKNSRGILQQRSSSSICAAQSPLFFPLLPRISLLTHDSYFLYLPEISCRRKKGLRREGKRTNNPRRAKRRRKELRALSFA